MQETHRTLWAMSSPELIRNLGSDDDDKAWKSIIDRIGPDAEYLSNHNPENKFIKLSIGCCSRWLRPHQNRWTAGGGFALPSGYAGHYPWYGLPQHDWEIILYWDRTRSTWQNNDARKRFKSRQSLEFRVSIPARTSRHDQAAVFTIWMPGSPPMPKKQLIQFYGFRKIAADWTCTATSGPEDAYDTVSAVDHDKCDGS